MGSCLELKFGSVEGDKRYKENSVACQKRDRLHLGWGRRTAHGRVLCKGVELARGGSGNSVGKGTEAGSAGDAGSGSSGQDVMGAVVL